MRTGLLWFDNDPNRELKAKVADAARCYREKFGLPPNICYVNQAALSGNELRVSLQDATVRVLPAANILTHHFWVGIEEAPVAA